MISANQENEIFSVFYSTTHQTWSIPFVVVFKIRVTDITVNTLIYRICICKQCQQHIKLKGLIEESVCKNKSLVHEGMCIKIVLFPCWFPRHFSWLLVCCSCTVCSLLILHAHWTDSQPGKKPGASFIVCRNGAVSGVVIKSMEVFAALWTKIKRACKVF